MNFLVTGLCLQGNKGGPAIALSLAAAIKDRIPDATFTFSVPGSEEEWPHETKWADRYGYDIIKNPGFSCITPPTCFSKRNRYRLSKWLKTLNNSNALIQMSAISYVGPPSASGTISGQLRSTRVFDLFFSTIKRKRLLAWTQSYGPLTSLATRTLARYDLSRQKIVFCRGDDCTEAVKKLLPGSDARSFPDVATTLKFDKTWGKAYIAKHFALRPNEFLSLSPSAVLYSRSPEAHINECLNIIRTSHKQGIPTLIVPHTLRPNIRDPKLCDYTVSKIIRSHSEFPVHLVEEDLCPTELKSIISNASYHIGARYHSVVAALSSHTPTISLSWHPKYKDLMSEYQLEDFVVEEGSQSNIPTLMHRANANRDKISTSLIERQNGVRARVVQNAELFCQIIQKSVP